MLTVLHYLADGLWILAMSLIASTSRGALKRVPGEALMPMWGGLRLPRNLALGVMFGVPLVLGLALSFASATAVREPQGAVILFLVRAMLAGAFATLCLTWLRASLRKLEDAGVVRA